MWTVEPSTGTTTSGTSCICGESFESIHTTALDNRKGRVLGTRRQASPAGLGAGYRFADPDTDDFA